MTSATALRDIWEGIVTSHEAGVSFSSNWNTPLDEDHDQDYPRALWKEPNLGGILVGRTMYDAFTLTIWFEDHTATERLPSERDQAHSDMSVVARECFYRFKSLYIDRVTDGHEFRLEGTYTLLPYWDKPGTSSTGVMLSFTMVDTVAPCVTSDTFPLS